MTVRTSRPDAAASHALTDAARRHDLDVLRGTAVALILVLHAGALTPGIEQQPLVHALVSRGSVGMQLFFVLSGYLISDSWDRAQARPRALRTFALRRVAKIAPLYLLMLHLNLAVYAWQSAQPAFAPLRNSVTAENLTVPNYLAHLFVLQGLIPPWQHSLLDGSWSIAAEVYFYAAAPWLLSRVCIDAGATLRYLGIALLVAAAFAYLARDAAGAWGYYGLPSQFPAFLCGVLVHRLRRDQPAMRAGSAAIALMGTCAMLAAGMLKGTTSPLGLHHVYAALFGAILFATLTRAPSATGTLPMRALASLGRMSYAMFFAHLFLLKLIHPWLAANWTPQQWPQALAINAFVALFGSLLLSLAVLHPIDKAFVALARRRG